MNCESGSFKKVTVEHFKALLSQMGELQLISQLTSGELVLAINGEKLVDHYTFYAVFKTPEEYRIVSQGKSLGTLPVTTIVLPDQHIVFGGRRWKVGEVDIDKKVITVNAAKGGKPPNFGGEGMSIHDRVRQEMFQIYQKGDYKIDVGESRIEFLDSTARDLFFEGLKFFKNAGLEYSCLLSHGKYVYIIPWVGDKIINTLVILLVREGFKASNCGGVIEIVNASEADVQSSLKKIVKDKLPTEGELASTVKDKLTEKYDYLLSESLLQDGYGVKAFDVTATQ